MEYLATAIQLAREAGGILRHYAERDKQVEFKGWGNLVTIADKESEERIIRGIRERYPNHSILAEESGLSASNNGAEFRWVIDPLDGTTNFAHGFPVFAVSMALERRLENEQARIAGIVYDPTRDELFSAEQGKGAQLNGKPIHVSKISGLKECLVATGFPSHKRHKNPNIFFYHEITLKTHGVRRAGSAALDLCYVASGRFDGFWEFNLNPWDTAAGTLIVEEAGGRVSRFDAAPFELNSRETLASNGLVHEALVHEFQEIFAGRGLGSLPDPRAYQR